MAWIRNYFNEHRFVSYLTNAIVTFLFVIVLPSSLLPNFKGFLVGIMIAILFNAMIGSEWQPFREKNEA